MAAYSVTQHGNWEGRNILEFVGDIDQRPALAEARHKLFHAREKRVHPGRDDVQLAQMQPIMSQYPLGFGQWLQALACALSKPREIAIVGDPEASHTQVLLNIVRDGYQPFQVVALGAPHPDESTVPLLRDRGPVDERPAAYVCRGFVCRVPVTSPLDLEELLNVR